MGFLRFMGSPPKPAFLADFWGRRDRKPFGKCRGMTSNDFIMGRPCPTRISCTVRGVDVCVTYAPCGFVIGCVWLLVSRSAVTFLGRHSVRPINIGSASKVGGLRIVPGYSLEEVVSFLYNYF